jgi:NADH:ubiquinone oxidoreductase subunit 6 (subunit J)
MSGVMVIRSKNPVNSVLFLILVFCNATGLLILVDLDFFAMIFLVVYVGAIAVLFLFVVMMLNIKMAEINENVLRYLPIGGIIGIIFLFEIFLMVDNDIAPLVQFSDISTLDLKSEYNLLFYSGNAMVALNFIYNRFFDLLMGMLYYFYITIKLKRFFLKYNNFCKIHTKNLPGAPLDNPWLTEWGSCTTNVTNIESLGAIIYTYYFYYFLVASIILLVAMIGAIVLTMHKSVNVKRQEVFEQNARQFKKTVRPFKQDRHLLNFQSS